MANQVMGVAEALGWPFEVKGMTFNRLSLLPNRMLPVNLAGVDQASRRALVPPWPDLVIGSGRRTARVARWLKKQNPSTFLAQTQWPDSAEGLDLIAVPEHDRVPDHPAIMRTIGAPHIVTAERLAKARDELAPRLAHLPRPHVACLVGGTNRHTTFTTGDARRLGEEVSALAGQRAGSLLITTSRRTGAACTEALTDALSAPHFLHVWAPNGDNPYLGLLGSADAVVVTSESTSMCTEACATGQPVFLFHQDAAIPKKFAALHRRLEQFGCLRTLGAPWFEVPMALPNPADEIAAAIAALLMRRKGAFSIGQVASRTAAS
jgi:mitochondrial fission protein ELM1